MPSACCATRQRDSGMTSSERIACSRSARDLSRSLTPAVVAPPRHHTSADGTPDGDSMLSRTGASGGPPPMTSAEVSSSAGELRLDFGRYAGWSLYDLAKQDPAYLRWLARHSSGLRFRREIARVLGDPLDDPYAPSR